MDAAIARSRSRSRSRGRSRGGPTTICRSSRGGWAAMVVPAVLLLRRVRVRIQVVQVFVMVGRVRVWSPRGMGRQWIDGGGGGRGEEGATVVITNVS